MLSILLFLLRLFTFVIACALGIGIFFLYRIQINENEFNKVKQVLYFVFTLLLMFTFKSYWFFVVYLLLNLGEYMRKNSIEEMIVFEEEKIDEFVDDILDRDISEEELNNFINEIIQKRITRKNKSLIIYVNDYDSQKKIKHFTGKKANDSPSKPVKVIIDFPLKYMQIFTTKIFTKFSFVPKKYRKKIKQFKRIYKTFIKTKDPFSITVKDLNKNKQDIVKIFLA